MFCNANTLLQTRKHSPASVDSDRQDVVVKSLLHHADDLRLRGDLSALQALQAEQGDGRDWKRLTGQNGKKKRVKVLKREGLRSHGGEADSLTMGTTLTDRAVKPGWQPILVRLG